MCTVSCFTGENKRQFLEDAECKDTCSSGLYHYSETDTNKLVCVEEGGCTLKFQNKNHNAYYSSG